jgi:hypothetical protein
MVDAALFKTLLRRMPARIVATGHKPGVPNPRAPFQPNNGWSQAGLDVKTLTAAAPAFFVWVGKSEASSQ